ncbi:hypothetical protein [Tepidanaerobacter acetatoxydans]|uniref:hypothetical protein n=1 Tax=Tepidanaerobacter acetatoxydans TaxID=499229 RepID=UPI001BD26820|nr:hypothetical protein [Tepidanaerobacter acetatoxydans]
MSVHDLLNLKIPFKLKDTEIVFSYEMFTYGVLVISDREGIKTFKNTFHSRFLDNVPDLELIDNNDFRFFKDNYYDKEKGFSDFNVKPVMFFVDIKNDNNPLKSICHRRARTFPYCLISFLDIKEGLIYSRYVKYYRILIIDKDIAKRIIDDFWNVDKGSDITIKTSECLLKTDYKLFMSNDIRIFI